MTLDEFIAQTKKDIDQFEKSWREAHARAPADWPMQMGNADWLEQFLTYQHFDR